MKAEEDIAIEGIHQTDYNFINLTLIFPSLFPSLHSGGSETLVNVQQECGVIQEVGQLFSELEEITDWFIFVEDLGMESI